MNYAENHPARTAFKRKLIETDLGQLYLWLSGIHVRPAANRRRLSCPDRIAERSTDYRTNMRSIFYQYFKYGNVYCYLMEDGNLITLPVHLIRIANVMIGGEPV